MQTFRWLTHANVTKIHQKSIEKFGGSDGIRDAGLLESALARPQNLQVYEGVTDIHQIAASYAESIAQNHPYLDGNKRTGFASAGIFLLINGYSLSPEINRNHTEKMEALAQGKISRAEMAAHLKAHSRAVE